MKGCLSLMVLVLVLALPLMAAGQPPEPSGEKDEADRLIEIGLILHNLGEYEKAVMVYERAIEIKPTAQAYTYMAWAYSYLKKLDLAIVLAEKAIELDPDFGNPYNDIGAYLIQKGQYDQAIPFLKKAMRAKDYCCYFYPHFNLGRIYVIRGDYASAIAEFKEALKIKPDYLPAYLAIEYVKQKMQEAL